jgi:ArsR family transcriptional regulator
MDTKNAISALAALAQESRLSVFRMLVEAGPAGMSPGVIAERLSLPGSSLSFHLKELSNANLITPKQEGRYVNYAANFPTMNSLIAFLTDNCCSGVSCAPARASDSAC